MMSKKTIIRISAITLVAVGAFLVLRSTTTTQAAPKKENCKEIMNECCNKKDKPLKNSILFETMSKQFISIAL